MVCQYCGAQVEDETLAVYCKKCGKKLIREETGQEAEGPEDGKSKTGRKKWYLAAAGGAILLIAVIVLLVVMQGPGAFRNPEGGTAGSRTEAETELYGEWSDENGLLSMTFREDGTVRIGAGSGFLGADLFTFTEEGGDTLYLKAQADGLLGDLLSLQIDYEMQGDEMRVSFLGMEYFLKRK
ncbi:MAG: hypothetical protein NC541_03680 [bacterium]|nr:hypothetical protein [bacterium]